ncbi:uncharacterized protein dbf4b [Periophthalmus magnuspinnatus]|uniref:uncharacterized protein dbf4b n=1 Tax=Periophthalmus magnuspinnatus TaxID=409849 RepID=UPI002437374E|nr:uncharacterized protein dbf4b [Periophthalmus magnuspinnatus]
MEQRMFPEKGGLLGKLAPGEKKLDGRTFYLDRIKKRSAALLLEAITLFGGKIESFLHKDVDFVVTGCLEELEQKASDSKTKRDESTPAKQQESVLKEGRQKQATPKPPLNVCGSRGKALLEKAILNNERLQKSSVLTNARSWGVKILYADDVLLYLKQLSRESLDTKSKKSQKVYTKQIPNVVKAAPLRSPYLKVEDSSRKYKPLHVQSMNFPSLYYSGRYSPFECPPPPCFDKWKGQEEKKDIENLKVTVSTENKSQTPLSCNPSPWRRRKKDVAYCECCRQTYKNQEEHLQTDQHRTFVLESSNYSVVDQLVPAMAPGFDPDPPSQPQELNGFCQTSPNHDACELEPLTDLETEDAVKELKDSNFTGNIPILISDTVSPPPGIQPPTANQNMEVSDGTPDADAKTLSPAMPVLEKMPRDPSVSEPHLDTKPLSPCPVNLCLNPDPFPPILSPQLPDLHSHSSYMEAPILSPQLLTSQEPKHESIVQIDNLFSVSQSVILNAHHSLTSVRSSVKLPEKNQPEIKVCYNICERRSRSLPRQTTMTLNTKKRSRSASPEYSTSKRRRTNEFGGYAETKNGQKSEITKDKYLLFFESATSKIVRSFPQPATTFQSYCTIENQDSTQALGTFTVPQMNIAAQWQPSLKPLLFNTLVSIPDKCQHILSSQNSEHSNSHSTSVCIESALIPDMAALSSSSSESDWDCELLSRLGRFGKAPTSKETNGELDKDLLHQPCPWKHNSSYESRLQDVLQPTTQPITVDSSAFSRTVVQIVEVLH